MLEERLRSEEERRLRLEENERLRRDEEERARAAEEERLRLEREERLRVAEEGRRRLEAELAMMEERIRSEGPADRPPAEPGPAAAQEGCASFEAAVRPTRSCAETDGEPRASFLPGPCDLSHSTNTTFLGIEDEHGRRLYPSPGDAPGGRARTPGR